MGTCFGHCFKSGSRRPDRRHSLYRCKTGYVQFDRVKDTDKRNNGCLHLPHSLTSHLSLLRKKEPQQEVSLQLIESSWSYQCCDGYVAQSCLPYRHHTEPSRLQSDQQFHPLDPKAFLAPLNSAGLRVTQETKSLHSTPPSSIDLEWENEAYFHPRTIKDEEEDSDSAAVSYNNNIRSRTSHKAIHTYIAHAGSRQGSVTLDSSNGSKEGSRMTTPDSLEWDFVDSSIPTIDQETEQLIVEIERLAANALLETGNYSSEVNEDISSGTEDHY